MDSATFSQLSLSPELQTAVTEMGFTAPTDVQAESIPAIRSGADILARSQTGTGKTVAFGIPAVERIVPGEASVQVLILSPTRELAHQCGEEIRKLSRHLPGVKAVDIFGGGDYRDQFRELRSANLIVGTPGRIMDHMRRGTLDLHRLKMVVLDEADEMLNMGFREDIETILHDVPEERQIVLFSATLPEEILSIAQQFQHEPVRIEINREQITLENIHQLYVQVPMKQKPEALTLLLHYYQPNRAIIFSNTKTMVDELTDRLSAAGFSAEGLHGDMKQLQRTTVMNGFRKGRVSILIATDVAARGIDVSDIDYVVNFDIPKESDSYVHRIGRTGRAGRAGTALTLCTGRAQVSQLQRIVTRTRSTIEEITLPTVADIENANRQRTLADLEKALRTDPLPLHAEMIAELLRRGHDAQRIAATLLGMAYVHDTRALKNLTVPVSAAKTARPSIQVPKASLLLTIGSESRVSERHIVGALTEWAGISAHAIGKIQIAESFTTVRVPKELLNDIIQSMRGRKICGKPVQAMPLPEQPLQRRKPAHRADPKRGPSASAGRTSRSFSKKPPKRT